MNGIDSLFKFLGGKGFRDLFLFLSHVELLRINNFLPVFNLFLPRSLDSRKFGLKLSSFYKCENRLSVKVGIKWVPHGRSYLKCQSFSGSPHPQITQKTTQSSCPCAKIGFRSSHCSEMSMWRKLCSFRLPLSNVTDQVIRSLRESVSVNENLRLSQREEANK